MLQAQLEAMLQAKEGDVGGDISPSVNDLTSGDPDVSGVRSSVFDVGGFGGAAPRRRRQRDPRQRQPIQFWHDLFHHINQDGPYPWQNSDRKILANAARKYGVPALMAMWDISRAAPGWWFKKTGGTVYGMIRDSEDLLGHGEFKYMQRKHEERLLKQHHVWDAVLNASQTQEG